MNKIRSLLEHNSLILLMTIIFLLLNSNISVSDDNGQSNKHNSNLIMMDKYKDRLKDLKRGKTDSTCALGFQFNSNNTIEQVSEYDYTYGLRVNDVITHIDSIVVNDNTQLINILNNHNINDSPKLTVNRNGKKYTINLPCRDSNDMLNMISSIYKKAASGDWKGCIDTSIEFDRVWGLYTNTAITRLDCTFSRDIAIGQNSLEFYEISYELMRRRILEHVWDNKDFNLIVADVMTTIDFLRKNNQMMYANDLKKLWEKYSSQYAENSKPPNIQDNQIVSTGTCFVISPSGEVITAQHVIDGASNIKIKLFGDNEKYEARVIQSSNANDIALLKINKSTPNWLSFKSTKKMQIGIPIFTMGFPVSSILGSEAKFTDGVVSSKSGIGNEAAFFQITIPIQPGNSGGPVVTKDGKVIGIVTSTAAVKNFINTTGTIPQNVNWAVKSDYAMLLFNQPYKQVRITNRNTAIDHVNKALCFIEAIYK